MWEINIKKLRFLFDKLLEYLDIHALAKTSKLHTFLKSIDHRTKCPDFFNVYRKSGLCAIIYHY